MTTDKASAVTKTFYSRRTVARAFQQHGLAAEAAAVDAMRNMLAREDEENAPHVLEQLLRELRERTLSNNNSNNNNTNHNMMMVSAQLLAQVVADWTRSDKDAAEEALQLVNAFSMPRLQYDSMRQHFSLHVGETYSLFGAAVDKPDMLLQRYALLHQRILRQELFRPQLGGGGGGSKATHKITPVESLLGTHGPQLLLGMIVQVEEGQFYLEDATAQVPIRLAGASVLTDGFVTESSIMLVEGEYVDGILVVHRLGSPLIEPKVQAIQAMGLQASDIFQSLSTLADVQKMKEQEAEHGPKRMFVVVSDIYLDQPHVLAKLEMMLDGFCPNQNNNNNNDDNDDMQDDDDLLPVFVFMGNFSSVPLPSHVMMGHFDELANLISKFPRLALEARFILIPGPHDLPGDLGHVLPRPPLPASLTYSLRTKLRHVHFGSNPCRLRYFSKELVLYRQDVVHMLLRHSLLDPRDAATADHNSATSTSSTDIHQHAVKTMLDQAHLCPVPLTAQPVYWQLDHALRLYPLPDAVICGDRVAQYYENYADCDAINPGCFSKDYSFVVYKPVAEVNDDDDDDDDDGQTKSQVEFSQIGSNSSD